VKFLHTHKYKLIFLCVALISLTLTYFLCSLPSASEYETEVFQNKSVQTVVTEEKTDENNANKNEILPTATPEKVCITTATPSPAASTVPTPAILPTPSPTAEPVPSQEAVVDETLTETIDVVIASPMPEISPSPVLPTPTPDTKTDKPDEATQSPHPQTTSSEKAVSQEKKTEETSQTKDLTCTLSIRCDTILDNTKNLDENIISILPPDGIILKEQKVIISENDSVFDILMRETKKHKIHLEYVSVPIQGGTYIEGIYNIYEFDCGELSGWMYKVNGEFPQISSSDYTISAGDKIEWVYTCDLGKDVGKIIKETD